MAKKKTSHLPIVDQDVAAFSWLRQIRNAYTRVDEAVDSDLQFRAQSGAASPACSKGCNVCCRKMYVPATHIELSAISWYLSERADDLTARTIIEQMKTRNPKSDPCPLLVDGACGVYPVRPLICRHFHVARKPCGEDESVLEERPDDVLFLGKSAAHFAATEILLASGHGSRRECEDGAISGAMPKLSTDIMSLDFSKFAAKIEDVRRSKAKAD